MKTTSVVVATYRREADLVRALQSLAVQTYPCMQIVLVDDNGDPVWNGKVAAIVDRFQKDFPSISIHTIVNQPNQGSAKARNIGISAAQGEYITFLDDDDVYLPDKVKNQTEFMECGGYDYSVTDLFLYDEQGKEIDRRIRNYIQSTRPEDLTLYHLKYHITGTDTMMFKKDYLLQIGCFAPIDLGDEFYLMQRAIDGGGRFGYMPGCDIKAYVHTGEEGLSSGESKIQGENALYEYKKTYFSSINASSRRYIRMRHHAVLAFAYQRMKRPAMFFKHGVLSAMAAPVACLKLLIGRKL